MSQSMRSRPFICLLWRRGRARGGEVGRSRRHFAVGRRRESSQEMELVIPVSVKDLLCLCSFLVGVNGVLSSNGKSAVRFEGKSLFVTM